jgi:F-type H+-transporting ATPase subunit delta
MFHAGRWAQAFLSVSGADANEAFLCLNALAARVKTFHGALMGHTASLKLEKLLRESVASSAATSEASGGTKTTPAVEYAIRFLCLLVEKKYLMHLGLLLERIEQELDKQNGILGVTVESAVAVESGFEKELTRMIKDKTGAAGIKIKTIVRPDLLGGFLMRIGSHYIDASLKGQLESMAAYLSGNTGGRNG